MWPAVEIARTVERGGNSFGSARHGQPVHSTYRIALTTSRKLVVRGRPIPAGSGITGSIKAHSASVVSLAKRSSSRRYCNRVISVQGMATSLESWQIRRNHIPLKSLTPFRPASEEGASFDGHPHAEEPREARRLEARGWLLRMRVPVSARFGAPAERRPR